MKNLKALLGKIESTESEIRTEVEELILSNKKKSRAMVLELIRKLICLYRFSENELAGVIVIIHPPRRPGGKSVEEWIVKPKSKSTRKPELSLK